MAEQFQIVDVPGHGEVEFPTSMSDTDVLAVVRRLSSSPAPETSTPRLATNARPLSDEPTATPPEPSVFERLNRSEPGPLNPPRSGMDVLHAIGSVLPGIGGTPGAMGLRSVVGTGLNRMGGALEQATGPGVTAGTARGIGRLLTRAGQSYVAPPFGTRELTPAYPSGTGPERGFIRSAPAPRGPASTLPQTPFAPGTFGSATEAPVEAFVPNKFPASRYIPSTPPARGPSAASAARPSVGTIRTKAIQHGATHPQGRPLVLSPADVARDAQRQLINAAEAKRKGMGYAAWGATGEP